MAILSITLFSLINIGSRYLTTIKIQVPKEHSKQSRMDEFLSSILFYISYRFFQYNQSLI